MINPHNPEFITKRPWYLGGNDDGPSLDHQADQRTEAEKLELSMASADHLVRAEREKVRQLKKMGKLQVGMWVEALRKNRKPYLMCRIVRMDKHGAEFDLEYEDGSVERKRDSYHGYEVSDGHMQRMEEKYSKRDAVRRNARSTGGANKEKNE
eukprot:scaffold46163_cov31-Attheya_sp.AAC.1